MPKIPNETLSSLSEFIESQMGLHFPEDRWPDLMRGIESAASGFGYNDLPSFIGWLKSAPLRKNQVEALAARLTVGETYFFREPDLFETLEKQILPKLIAERRSVDKRIRVWSAGCSTGEEAYSIAILLKRLIPDISGWNVAIIGTDINPNALSKASVGRYGEWSFRGTARSFRDMYFKKTGDGLYEISGALKRMVSFSYLNLAEDAYPSLLNNTNAMDLIFCRNVLMYFSHERALKAVNGFHNCLVHGGWLALSPAESIRDLTRLFEFADFPRVALYRKPLSALSRNVQAETVLFQNPQLKPGLKEAFVFEEPETCEYEPMSAPVPAQAAGRVKAPVETLEIEKAVAEYASGRYVEAASILEGLCAKGKAGAEALSFLSRSYANQGKLEMAAKWCSAAISEEKLNPSHHYLLAIILQEQGLFEEAVKSLRNAIYLDHDFVLAYFMLGNLMARLGNAKESSKLFKNASRILGRHRPEDVIPGSDGMTAGRLSEIIASKGEVK